MRLWLCLSVIITLISLASLTLLRHASYCAETQQAWGEPSQGISVSLSSLTHTYHLGDDINIWTRPRNNSKKMHILWLTGADYRWIMYDDYGNPVPKTPNAMANESVFPVGYSELRIQIKLQPGAIFPPIDHHEGDAHNINSWFHITQPGRYHILAIRRIDLDRHGTFDFALSNMLTIDITK